MSTTFDHRPILQQGQIWSKLHIVLMLCTSERLHYRAIYRVIGPLGIIVKIISLNMYANFKWQPPLVAILKTYKHNNNNNNNNNVFI